MLTSSKKQKGKRLEKWVVAKLLEAFPSLTGEDVRHTIGVESGADVKLSIKAKIMFPYQVEAKNQERIKLLYDFYSQAQNHGTQEPLVVVAMNHMRPLAIVDAEHFINLIKDKNAGK